MAPRLQILGNIIERLWNLNTLATGHLYGIIYNNTLTVLTFTLNTPTNDDNTVSHRTLQCNMPAEVYMCGLLHVGDCNEPIPDDFKDIDITDNPLFAKYSPGESEIELYFYIHQKLESVSNMQVITESDILQQFTYVRLQGSLPMITQNFSIADELQETRKKIALGKIAIHFPSSNTFLFNNNENLKDISLSELLHTSQLYKSSVDMKNETKRPTKIVNVINANILLKISGDKLSEEYIKYAPILQHVKRTFESLKCELHIDTLSLVSQKLCVTELYAILVESICRNIKLVENWKNLYSKEEFSKDTYLLNKLPRPIHFKPQDCGHLFTVIYPENYTDSETVEYRTALHKGLGLNMNKPYFRQGNSVIFSSDMGKNDVLINPHESLLQNEGVSQKLSIVDGLYAYHHYMQDGFDDNGWGCAYRSLQTIVSWYRLQGYTDVPIPSHHTIQKCLVEINDKPFNFVGSTQWIGSMEVGFVLETLLGIGIKVLCASSGEEMSSLAPDLLHHFQTQGTPVMIGGGVLAHTILGICIEESSGEVKFLILDPHYTGPEHLTTIINKGYCGWKTKDFWKKDAFYNMCLPQRPVCI